MARPRKTVKTEPSETTEQSFQEVAVEQAVEEQEKAETAPTFTQEQVQAMIAKAVADALAAQQQQPKVVQVSAEVEKVHFLWQAEVAQENVFEIGPGGTFGRIVGKTGEFYVPKNELSRVVDGLFRKLMERRWIIVLDGMTDDERVAYGVDYKEGEYLDKKAFAKLVDLGERILEIYPKLCEGHREMVAKRFYEEYTNHNKNVTREIVVELNRMSKQLGSENGDFTGIIEAMNRADMQ